MIGTNISFKYLIVGVCMEDLALVLFHSATSSQLARKDHFLLFAIVSWLKVALVTKFQRQN